MGTGLVFQMEREIVFCGEVKLILRMRTISILGEYMGPQALVCLGLCPSLLLASTLSGANAKDQFMKL